jgi:hypothetical protein
MREGASNKIKYMIMPLIGAVILAIAFIFIGTGAKILGCIWLAIGIIYLAIKTKGFKELPPEMTFEDLLQTMKSRQAKVDIIKKNNNEITKLKDDLKEKIVYAANKVNELKIEVQKDNVIITDETLEELKELLTFLQESKRTLEEDAEKISAEIESILDLLSTKSMQQLDKYDLIIERQNEVIVEMKTIMQTISKI